MAEVPCLLFIEGQEPKEIIWDIQGELSQIGQFVGLSHYEVQYLPSDPLASPVIVSSNDHLQNLLREHGVESHLVLLVKNTEKQEEEVAPAPVPLEESLPVPEEKPSKPSLPPFFQKIAEALQASPNSSNNVAELKGLVDQYTPLLPPFLKDLSSQFFAAVEQSANSTGASSSSSAPAPSPAPAPAPAAPAPVFVPVAEEKPVDQPKEEVKNDESEDSTVEIELEIPPFFSAFAAPFFLPMRRGNCPFFASPVAPFPNAGCHSRSGEAPAACFAQPSPAEVPASTSASPRVPYQHVHTAKCDHCQKRIVGIRYKCSVCHDYDLCEKCEELNVQQGGTQVHSLEHPMLKMFRPKEASLEYITRALEAINAGKPFYG